MSELSETVRKHLASNHNREEKARQTVNAIRESGGYRWVGLYDVEENEIAVIAWAGPGAPAYPRFPRSQGLNGIAVAQGKTVVVQDVRKDSSYLQTLGDTMAEMIVPVRAATGQIIGTIDVESALVNAFSERDHQLLGECAVILRLLWET